MRALPRARAHGGILLLPLLALSGGCAHGLFSGVEYPDRSRPVARIETRGGVEFGATTAEGVLFLGRTAIEGPCRVHYFLGPKPTIMVENGTIEPAGGIYYRADMDLKTQAAPVLERSVETDDDLIAVLHMGSDTREVPVRLARTEGVTGDVLEWPGESLPAGTGLFCRIDERLHFVGLVAGEASLSDATRFLVYTGIDRLREALAKPQPFPREDRIIHRPDDISVIK
ncbi:MAG: hypothetical protein AAF628_19815 [Planctomycetota bacterium]